MSNLALVQRNARLETPVTWYRTPKWEFQKSAGAGCWHKCWPKSGCWQECWHKCWQAGPFVNTETHGLPAPLPALRPAPPFWPALVPPPPPALSGIPISGSCTRSPGSQCSSNIFDEHSCFIDFSSFSSFSSSPLFLFSSPPVFLDILKPKLCPYGDASGIDFTCGGGTIGKKDQHQFLDGGTASKEDQT